MTTEKTYKINVQGIAKCFAQERVLSEVSFSAEPGEIVAVLGGSGSGKTTLLRCLNLLEEPDAGQIAVNGLRLDFSAGESTCTQEALVTLRTKVGMVFQQFHLWAHMTVLQNLIEAPMHVLHLPKAEAITQAEALLERMNLLEKKETYPSQLSGGQQQRVAIARALMMQPDVMLFDEPTSSLDPKMVAEMIKLIRGLADKGMTVVIATHEMMFARELADKTLFLHQGEVAEQGETKAMFQTPQTEAFQQFIQLVGEE